MSVENMEEIELVSLDLPLVFRLPLVYEDLCNMFENICKFYNRRMISKRLARGWKKFMKIFSMRRFVKSDDES